MIKYRKCICYQFLLSKYCNENFFRNKSNYITFDIFKAKKYQFNIIFLKLPTQNVKMEE